MVSSPHALHTDRVVTVNLGRGGWGGKHNSSKASHLVTDRVTSLIEGLISAQSKAVLELV